MNKTQSLKRSNTVCPTGYTLDPPPQIAVSVKLDSRHEEKSVVSDFKSIMSATFQFKQVLLSVIPPPQANVYSVCAKPFVFLQPKDVNLK